ncbi:hypothetical protein ACFXAF_12465 [Kitasatospora sp. NPDC059463]|uniref:hypothetical protein n=1 Tax=unclassified Kitasatospora TaxID=2633591 RepID=UPI0036CB207B
MPTTHPDTTIRDHTPTTIPGRPDPWGPPVCHCGGWWPCAPLTQAAEVTPIGGGWSITPR